MTRKKNPWTTKTPPKRYRTDHPIWEMFSTTYIAERTGYAEGTVILMKGGHKKLSWMFRSLAEAKLERPESELFREEEKNGP